MPEPKYYATYLLMKTILVFAFTYLLAFSVYLADTPWKNSLNMFLQIGWFLATLYWAEFMEGGLLKITGTILCGLVRFKVTDS